MVKESQRVVVLVLGPKRHLFAGKEFQDCQRASKIDHRPACNIDQGMGGVFGVFACGA